MKRMFSLLFVGVAIVARGADFPAIAVPKTGQLRDAAGVTVSAATLGQAPGTQINNQRPLAFSLAGITPGTYRVGFVIDTGTHVHGPYNQTGAFALAVEMPDGKTNEIAALRAPEDAALKPVRRAGEEQQEWAAWRGFAVAGAPAWLTPESKVLLRYNAGGSQPAVALWLEKTQRAADKINVAIGLDAVDGGFTPANPPKFTIVVRNASDAAWNGLVRVDVFDLYLDRGAPEFLPCRLAPQGETKLTFAPKLANSVFRVTARPADGKDAAQTGFSASQVLCANAPAKLAKELPDDWPLGTHHYNPSPILKAPMSGFKWYRSFIGWGEMNPAPGQYNWKEVDATLEDIRKVGGKFLVCMEGAPLWTSNKPDRRQGHVAPKDWNDLRTFVKAFVARYGQSDVLQAVEPWNEPNANLRWHDTYESLVELHKIWFEETRGTKIKVVGLSISPGHHVEYVEGLTEAGILQHMDIMGAHFYEESGSLNRLNPRNSLPLHMELIRIPMMQHHRFLPIWNTEMGAGWIENVFTRPGGRMPTQNEAIRELRAKKDFNSAEPWLHWHPPSEQRKAAEMAKFPVIGLANGVVNNFTFHPNWYSLDGALNLSWVVNACLGHVLEQVDYRYVMPLAINAVGGPADIGAQAYRIGKPGGKQVVMVWAERCSPKQPHAGGWSEWVEPVPIQLPCAEGLEVTVQDLYLRGVKKVKAENHPGGHAVTIAAGEEPVFVWGWRFRDQ